jgi:hypothetical protein
MAGRKSSKLKPVELVAPGYTLGAPDFATPSLTTTNIPEFVALQHEAIRHFRIDAEAGRYPKLQELVAYFKTRRLSDGKLVSSNLARYLATFCRPVGAMSGGNRRMKPFNR